MKLHSISYLIGSIKKLQIQQKPNVKTIAKALRILELFANVHSGLRLKEISGQAGLNKATTYRFEETFERPG